MATVLVTGGSGFIGSYCILQLLEAGHAVRTTIRNLAREPEVRSTLEKAGAKATKKQLAFFAADLNGDPGWAEAVKGCDYVLHVASPFPMTQPKDENDLIVPAREGALRVLRAARDAGVKRVVMTSSFAAIGYGLKHDHVVDETSWTDSSAPGIGAYVKSKTIAERAAWDFVKAEGGAMELAVVNPVGVLGPVLGPDFSTSILIVERLLQGAIPMAPKASFGLVDVRDVADLHIRAMTDPAAKGERFLAMSGKSMSIFEVGQVLRAKMPEASAKVPTREAPNWMIRMMAMFSPEAKALLPQLGRRMNTNHEKAERVLGWRPRTPEDSILATAKSLIEQGIVKV
jgi:nucleoside-diphosphate-sugar epimerase